MKMNPLGRTGLMVSELCLGTMTWSNQTPAEDAFAQIERSFDAGINFMDTAEMYPVNPVAAETMGNTEKVIGDWFEKTGRRKDWILATKHSGEGSHARDGALISSKTIRQTVEESLKRLKTDYIDLYQFHWPNRGSYMFRKNWSYDPSQSGWTKQQVIEDMEDCLGALQAEVERGTIRAFGLSNESAWGTQMWLDAAKRVNGPRVASIQNEYSLMCRLADTDLAELMVYEDVALLPFSPLAAGFLTGKYQGGAVPEGSRMSLNETMGGRKTPRAFEAAEAYLKVAADFGLDPVQMALAWSAQRPFVASSIFGATTLAQLDHLLPAADLALSEEVLTALDEAHKAHPMPY
ncbi:aryl-alcohol dehydrogenase-like predicted oxidoreductase [Sagittula marina]|uniref:Aryl-alcohol dehydrogenase-like predicted oxidoreductase n=1 Tax=Sagittula marina TaxID=943940 RepID=A0A7W6DSN0_9RHOB|nr:aldo/keto reductase [Sagittula marina]MBB3986981.1 aryl-alcohol dehydrogenase-like predicted oxidoreductase [Sagittula marina]